ncbi:MAG: alpha/beta fold hydrolase [Chloroflexi bacterium]|nr:alpha/beta fold hydrolase [Chloroflexota bacterium]
MFSFGRLASLPRLHVAAPSAVHAVALPCPPARSPGDDALRTTFWTRDGVPLAVTRRLRRTSGRPQARRAVLVVPGLFTSRESSEHRAFAERLTQIADVISVDVRGHGDSGGAFTWGQRESDDVAQLAMALRQEYDRLGAVGFSFGGYHVGAAAAARPFDAVAMVATPRSFALLDRHFLLRGVRRGLGVARRRSHYARRFSLRALCGPRRPAAAFVGAIAPTPLLIMHGTADWLLGTHHAYDLYARAEAPKSLVLVDGAPHAEGMMVGYADALVPPLDRFFDATLA